MIHIPDDIYEQIADYASENGNTEQENRDYADCCCNLFGVQFESKGIKDLIVEVDGWVSISYAKSHEIWGVELCRREASSYLTCKTWDEDGNDVINDFDNKRLSNYFKD